MPSVPSECSHCHGPLDVCSEPVAASGPFAAALSEATCGARYWPELTKVLPGTHKASDGLSENLAAEVSAHTFNPTGFFVEARARIQGLIRGRSGLCGKQVIPDTLSPSARQRS